MKISKTIIQSNLFREAQKMPIAYNDYLAERSRIVQMLQKLKDKSEEEVSFLKDRLKHVNTVLNKKNYYQRCYIIIATDQNEKTFYVTPESTLSEDQQPQTFTNAEWALRLKKAMEQKHKNYEFKIVAPKFYFTFEALA